MPLDTDWNEAHEEGPAAPTQKERWRMAALLAAGSAALLIAWAIRRKDEPEEE